MEELLFQVVVFELVSRVTQNLVAESIVGLYLEHNHRNQRDIISWIRSSFLIQSDIQHWQQKLKGN